jgi:metal transporter CNNM
MPQDVYMLDGNDVLDHVKVADIMASGHSRIPVFINDRNNVKALLYIRDLVLLDLDENITVNALTDMHPRKVLRVSADTKLKKMLNDFKCVSGGKGAT